MYYLRYSITFKCIYNCTFWGIPYYFVLILFEYRCVCSAVEIRQRIFLHFLTFVQTIKKPFFKFITLWHTVWFAGYIKLIRTNPILFLFKGSLSFFIFIIKQTISNDFRNILLLIKVSILRIIHEKIWKMTSFCMASGIHCF